MTTSAPRDRPAFYITGGTLPPDAPSYVERQADRDLLAALRAGEYCYLLNSRQMGKSSLCVRAIARLRQEGVRTVFLDLTKFGGRNLTAEQWYAALLAEVGRELGLRAECLQYWKEHLELPAVQRLFGAITEVALKADGRRQSVDGSPAKTGPAEAVAGADTTAYRLPSTASKLVLFIDEIDVTRSLPFSTDEFFAAIRQCSVGRATEPALKGVTFCLLGTATPAELIEDTRISPFNIGRRIEVRDFTPEEAAPLAAGLGVQAFRRSGDIHREGQDEQDEGEPIKSRYHVHPGNPVHPVNAGAAPERLLQRILYWTGGHPYLTQRLCRAVAEADAQDPNPKSKRRVPTQWVMGTRKPKSTVDRLCAGLFLTHTAKEGDDNLALVRNRLLKSEVELASLLELYGKLRAGQAVRDDETNPVCGVLKLSGVAKVESGRLEVRNRIYGAVFDRARVIQHMPDAELRRQREAYRRGLLRAAAVGGTIALVMFALAATAATQAQVARRARREAEHQREIARLGEIKAGRLAASLQVALVEATSAQDRAKSEAARAKTAEGREHAQRVAAQTAQGQAEAQRRRAKEQQQLAQAAAGEALQAAERERQEHQLALQRELGARRTLYGAQVNLAQQALEAGDAGQSLGLLEAQRPRPGQEDRRGFEWRYLWRLCEGSARLTHQLPLGFGWIEAAQPSPDGKALVAGNSTGRVGFWDIATGGLTASHQGHKGEIRSVAFSPNGRLVATCGADQTIKLWELRKGREVAVLHGHTDIVVAAAFSPDSKLLASAGRDRTVRLWNVATGQTVALLQLPDPAHTVAFSPDGEILAAAAHSAATNSDTVRLWQVGTQREVATLAGTGERRGFYSELAFSPDGQTLATVSGSNVKLWSVLSGQELATLQGHTAPITCLAFAPGGRTLATGSADNTVRLWSIRAGPPAAGSEPPGPAGLESSRAGGRLPAGGRAWREVAALSGHTDAIWCLAFSPDGQTLVSGSVDTTARLWDVGTQREVARLVGHHAEVFTAAFSSDGKTLATVDRGTVAKLWDVGAGRDPSTVLRSEGVVRSVAYSPNLLAVGSSDGTLRLWDAKGERFRKSLTGPATSVDGLAFSPDGRMLAAMGDTDKGRAAWLWATESGQVKLLLRGGGTDVRALAYSPDGRLLATGGGVVRLWDGHTGRLRAILRGMKSRVTALAFSPDGKKLAVSTRGVARELGVRWSWGTVTLWDLTIPWPVATLPGTASGLAFLPDGRSLLARTMDDGTVKEWDLGTRRVVASLGNPAPLRGSGQLALSPDGKTVAIGSGSALTLWNLISRQQVAVLRGHTGVVSAAAFAPDGSSLASGSLDGTTRLWHAAHFQVSDSLPVVSRCGDRVVRLQWHAVPHAAAYQVYRGPAGAPQNQMAKRTARPIRGTSYTDRGPGLVNGRCVRYAVAPLFPGRTGRVVEGTPVRLTAMPVAAPPGWLGSSMNEGERSGSVRFEPATGEITLRGSGRDIWDDADGCYLLNRPVTGDFRITANLLAGPTNTNDWAKAGVMIRDSLDPSARHAFLFATPGHRLTFEWRGSTDRSAVTSSFNGQTLAILQHGFRTPITLRLTRRSNAILAEFSHDDGRSFQPADDPLQFAEPLPQTLYVGLAVSSHDVSQVSEARFRGLKMEALASGSSNTAAQPAALFREANPLQVIASYGDRAVQLSWQPIPRAVAYQLYRGPADATRLSKLTARPVTGTTFTDRSPGLVSGRPVAYAVAPIIKGAAGKAVELTPVRLQAIPVAAPFGFLGSSINEGERSGSARFQPATGETILRGSGNDIWDQVDGFYFLNQPVTGDFEITVRALTRPTESNEWAKAGLMVRESLAAGARNGDLVTTAHHGLQWQWRPNSDDETVSTDPKVIPHAALKLPILLRLTRRGSTITAQYSRDNGRSFQSAGQPLIFDPPLASTIYAGLAITAHDESQVSEAKFSGLEIRKR